MRRISCTKPRAKAVVDSSIVGALSPRRTRSLPSAYTISRTLVAKDAVGHRHCGYPSGFGSDMKSEGLPFAATHRTRSEARPQQCQKSPLAARDREAGDPRLRDRSTFGERAVVVAVEEVETSPLDLEARIPIAEVLERRGDLLAEEANGRVSRAADWPLLQSGVGEHGRRCVVGPGALATGCRVAPRFGGGTRAACLESSVVGAKPTFSCRCTYSAVRE